MKTSPLHIAEVDQKKTAFTSGKNARRQEIQATLERLWLQDPEQFNPYRDAVQKKRIASTLALLKKHVLLTGKKCLDLGCGEGSFTILLSNEGGKVDAVDVSERALRLLKDKKIQNITAIHDCLPATCLADDAYDVVICTEVIGYLQPKEYRLLFAELCRLVNKTGYVLCSTQLDLDSENALERFSTLAETEFKIEEWILRYDLLWMKLCRFFEIPAYFFKMSLDSFERNKILHKKNPLSRLWFQINTTKPLSLLWRYISLITNPVTSYLRQSERLVALLEPLTKLLFDSSGITHALFISKRRPLIPPLAPNEVPLEPKHKKQVWE